MKFTRSSGILLHPTSFPGPYGVGDLGDEAFRFINFLYETGQQIWQVLPLGPVGYGNSPYQSTSTFAGNVLLLSPERLRDQGWLTQQDLDDHPEFHGYKVDFEAVRAWKHALLDRAAQNFSDRASKTEREALECFCAEHQHWLDDYALFLALREEHGGAAWTEWEPELIAREPRALEQARESLSHQLHVIKFGQFQFFEQWRAVREHCRRLGIQILGDVPIYVAHDSADVWAHQDLFQLDETGRPEVVAGVPPDYFCATGQLWGNPIYHWDRMAATGFAWWIDRIHVTLKLVDMIRLDHFRGFEAFWQVPSTEETAINGDWIRGPEDDIFIAFKKALGEPLPFIAEDLGVITPAVVALRERAGLLGMAVLQFGLGGNPESSSCAPHQYTTDLVAYTGTHDNETIEGWAAHLRECDHQRWEYVRNYLSADGQAFHWATIRHLMSSVADMVIFPLQDVLGLDNYARMNTPGVVGNNWEWRYWPEALGQDIRGHLRYLTHLYGRMPKASAEISR